MEVSILMRVLVTGGRGRIGRRVIDLLAMMGHEVVSLDLGEADGECVPNVSFRTGDVLDAVLVAQLLEGADAVVHLAGLASPRRYNHDLLFRVNVIGTYNLLTRAAEAGVKRVCLASSVNAVGAAFSEDPHYDYFPIDELHACYVEDPYGLSKWLGEQVADATARRHREMSISSLRIHFSVEDRAEAIAARASQGDMVPKHLWGYVRYEAVARAVLLAITEGPLGHEVYNIVAPDTVENGSTAALVERHYPTVPQRRPIIGRMGLFDTNKAETKLGWHHDTGATESGSND